MITLLAAIGRNGEIGYHDNLPWKIPEDMKHFKEYTTGKVVIMGRKTFASIGKVLPGRKCIVISTHDLNNLAVCAKDVESALSIEHCYPELVIIGGARIYAQTIELAHKMIITHIDADFEADTFFPKIDLTKWKINSVLQSSNEQYNYKFVEYIRYEATGNVD
jgi:dihydrofolate reductase